MYHRVVLKRCPWIISSLIKWKRQLVLFQSTIYVLRNVLVFPILLWTRLVELLIEYHSTNELDACFIGESKWNLENRLPNQQCSLRKESNALKSITSLLNDDQNLMWILRKGSRNSSRYHLSTEHNLRRTEHVKRERLLVCICELLSSKAQTKTPIVLLVRISYSNPYI